MSTFSSSLPRMKIHQFFETTLCGGTWWRDLKPIILNGGGGWDRMIIQHGNPGGHCVRQSPSILSSLPLAFEIVIFFSIVPENTSSRTPETCLNTRIRSPLMVVSFSTTSLLFCWRSKCSPVHITEIQRSDLQDAQEHRLRPDHQTRMRSTYETRHPVEDPETNARSPGRI